MIEVYEWYTWAVNQDQKHIDSLIQLKNRICVNRDVKFKEDETWNWEKYTKDFNLDKPEWTYFIIGNNETSGT